MDGYICQPLQLTSQSPFTSLESLESFLLAHEPPLWPPILLLIFLLLTTSALFLNIILEHIQTTHHIKEVQTKAEAFALFLEYLTFEDGKAYLKEVIVSWVLESLDAVEDLIHYFAAIAHHALWVQDVSIVRLRFRKIGRVNVMVLGGRLSAGLHGGH